MTIKILSDYQIKELNKLFLKCEISETNIHKIGIVLESGDLIVEYEEIGPYPSLNVGIETEKIPFNKPIK